MFEVDIKTKYNVIHIAVENLSDLDEIREMLESAKSVLGAEKLYKERYNVSADEAKRKVLDAVSKFNAENNGGKSSSGCMVTILIAITSTLSVLCLL